MRRASIAAIACLGAAGLVVLGAGEALSWPAARAVGAAPADLEAGSLRLGVTPGEPVSGWFARGRTGGGAILLLHGVRGDRRQMLGRARFLRAAGYSVLLIDLPAHGESPGDRITFGLREGSGVRAGLDYLRRALPNERIGVIGVSLGAASTVLSRPSPPPDAVVLESMYPTIEEAVRDRLALRLGPAGAALAPLLLAQLPLRLGFSATQLRPIDAIADLGAPVLIASGTRDAHTTWQETERLHAAAREPKELWAVEGAAHVDLHAFSPGDYETRILRFFARHLRAES